MKQIGEIGIKNRIPINDNSVNRNITNNDNSVTSNKYALDKSKFTPNTEESQLAESIAISFDDLDNYAFYFRLVKSLGVSVALSSWKSHKKEEEDKKGSKYEFRNSKKYFAWKFRKGLLE